MQIFRSLLGRERREQFVSRRPELFFCLRVGPLEHALFLTVSASFPNTHNPKTALCMCESRVWSLRLCRAGVTVSKGELVPLWSVVGSDPAAIGQRGFSCSVDPSLPNRQHVTLFTSTLKFHVSSEDWRFLPSLVSMNWLYTQNGHWVWGELDFCFFLSVCVWPRDRLFWIGF